MMTSLHRVVLAVLLMLGPCSASPAAPHEAMSVQMPRGVIAGIENKAKKKAPAKKAPQAKPATPKQPWELPMRVVIVASHESYCQPQCAQWISAEGMITGATAALFRRVLKQAGGRRLPVLISSPGGSVEAAAEIGRMIRKAGLDVAVGTTSFIGCSPEETSCVLPEDQKGLYSGESRVGYGYCASACPLILAGGVRRYATGVSHIGVHQLRTTWKKDTIRYLETYRIVNGKKHVISRKQISRKTSVYDTFGITKAERKMLDAYLDSMGVSHDLIDEMEKAAFTSINELTYAQSRALRLVNADRQPAGFWNICASDPAVPGCIAPDGSVVMPPAPVADSSTEMVVTLQRSAACDGSCPEWIAAEGVITSATPQRFRDILALAGKRRLPVILDSKGGDLDAALEIGRMIRAAGLSTAIAASGSISCSPRDAECLKGRDASLPLRAYLIHRALCDRECLLIIAAGKERLVGWASADNILPPLDGFHTSLKGKEAASLVKAYLAAMGVSPELAAKLGAIKGDLRLGPTDLIRYGLGTDGGEPDWIADSGLCQPAARMDNCVKRD